jgi:hypothetical protein
VSILFDQGTPVPLRRHSARHVVDTAFERGWSALHKGEVLDVSEQEGYDLLMTTNQNVRYQQHLADRQLAIIVLLATSWPRIQLRIEAIQAAVERIMPGDTKKLPCDEAALCRGNRISPGGHHGSGRSSYRRRWDSRAR